MDDSLLGHIVAERLSRVAAAKEESASLLTCQIVVKHWCTLTFADVLGRAIDAMSDNERRAWLANFTKSIVLSGQPAKLCRLPGAVSTGAIALFSRPNDRPRNDLTNLLKRFDAGMVHCIEFEAAAQADIIQKRAIDIVIDILTPDLQSAIVDLSHLLSEQWLEDGKTETPRTRLRSVKLLADCRAWADRRKNDVRGIRIAPQKSRVVAALAVTQTAEMQRW